MQQARQYAEAALERKAGDVVALDVSNLTSFTDAFVIASGTSDRHVKAVADAVVERAHGLGRKPLGVEGYETGEWVLIDLDDVIVHVFRGEKREQFDLERLWGDAPIVTFEEGKDGTVSRTQLP
ncbi:MAG TPA: ribosome silencing factor [Myxococcota bacterium]|jgi:ribosome-associated protein|nr:ribosome silencing factor [Myxococcota bacterium]